VPVSKNREMMRWYRERLEREFVGKFRTGCWGGELCCPYRRSFVDAPFLHAKDSQLV
jgi:hypothetical protein